MAYIWVIIQNYIVIQLSILAFFAPFYLAYLSRHKKFNGNKLTLSEHLERFFVSREANYLVFTWAALEAIIWFVIPEFLLLLIVFLRVKNKILLLKYDILGTLVGTLLAFVIAPTHMSNIPYVQPNMIKQVQVWYTHLGILGLLFQPFSGVPYKVFTLTADQFHFFLPLFLLFAVLVRISRYFFFYFLFVNLYPFLHRFVYKNYVPLFLIASFIFTIALLKIYNIYGDQYLIDYTFIQKYKIFSSFIIR